MKEEQVGNTILGARRRVKTTGADWPSKTFFLYFVFCCVDVIIIFFFFPFSPVHL